MLNGTMFTARRVDEKDAVIGDLQAEVRRLQSLLVEEKTHRSIAEANASRLRRNANKPLMIPLGDAESGYECSDSYCFAPIEQDFKFCPGCGREIDWRTYVPPEDDSAYDRWADK